MPYILRTVSIYLEINIQLGSSDEQNGYLPEIGILLINYI